MRTSLHLLLTIIAILAIAVLDESNMTQAAQSVFDDDYDNDDAYYDNDANEDDSGFYPSEEENEIEVADEEEDQEDDDTPEVAQLDFHVSVLFRSLTNICAVTGLQKFLGGNPQESA